ncbi:gliding motility protein [Streptomyces lavendofoliae]|uniref:gliding motility protein n=1 Tax=Streptomyces lavendofoliae TaxID=67314 RepID=UPI0027E55B8D|nr:gliding motility protein [Streptomyces lavendofoliae]
MTSADDSAEGAEKAAEASGATDTEPEAAAAEGVEIPKQQSAEEAADNEAGESARK